jgi:hypothetical protein
MFYHHKIMQDVTEITLLCIDPEITDCDTHKTALYYKVKDLVEAEWIEGGDNDHMKHLIEEYLTTEVEGVSVDCLTHAIENSNEMQALHNYMFEAWQNISPEELKNADFSTGDDSSSMENREVDCIHNDTNLHVFLESLGTWANR